MIHRCVALLLFTGCFGEPPTLAAPPDDDEDAVDGSSSSGGPSTLSSTASSAGTGGSDESESGDNGSSFAPTSGDEGSSSDGNSEGSSSSSGPPPYEGPYGDCWEGEVQTEEGEYLCPPSPCVVALPEHSACAPECGDGCDPGPDGLAAVCLPTIAVGTLPEVCVMPCAGPGAPCGELDCMDSTFEDAAGDPLYFCMWGAP